MASLGFAIYAACVDFLLQASALLHISYRDANSILFFLIWPAFTIGMALIIILQGIALWRSDR
jgi:hypothetical protein